MRNFSYKSPVAITACLAFLAGGALFVPLLGLQNDEALFASPLYEPKSWEYAAVWGKSHLALMLMTYLGTLKTLLYKPLLRWFGSGVWSVRIPMVLAAGLSIWILYRVLQRTAGERTAVVACCLLAADPIYLLTSVYDWGPVALQHLLVLAGVLLIVRFYQERADGLLAAAGFLFGLAIWDKALALWMLSGIALAAVLLCRQEIRKALDVRRVAVFAASFLAGAAPLLFYNAANGWATFRSNVQWDANEIGVKAQMLSRTFRGDGLAGLLTISAAGFPRNLNLYGLALALALTPFARGAKLRVALFAWIAMAAAWMQMALNAHVGGSAHHTILLWPLPYVATAAPLAAASERIGRRGIPILAAITVLLAGSNALVSREYYRRIAREGGPPPWSDSIGPLAERLKATPAPFVFCVDWGMIDNLRLIGRGRIPVRDGMEALGKPEMLRAMLEIPDAVFLGHTAETETYRGNLEKLLSSARGFGMRPELVSTIADRFGRPTFVIYRFLHQA